MNMKTQVLITSISILYHIGGAALLIAVVVLTLLICLLIILFVSKDN